MPKPKFGTRNKPFDFGHYAGLDARALEAEAEKVRQTGQLEHPVQRMVKLDKTMVDEGTRTVEFSASSEEPVDQWWGTEVLSHEKKAIRMDRIRTSAPMLVNHNVDDQVGVVETFKLEGGKTRAKVRFGKSARAEEIYQDVLDGIRPNVSIGYRIWKVQDITTKDSPRQTYRVIDWEPLEVTIASIPADITVGQGRTLEPPASRSQPVTKAQYEALKAQRSVRTLTAEEEASLVAFEAAQRSTEAPPAAPVVPAAPAAETRTVDVNQAVTTALSAERGRVAAIEGLAERHGAGIATLVAETRSAIKDGLTPDQFGSKLLALRGSAAPLPASAIAAEPSYKSEQLRDYSVLRAVRKLMNGEKVDGLEGEVHQEHLRLGQKQNQGRSILFPLHKVMAAQRVLNTNSGAAGGYLVGTENMGMIELLRNRAVLAQLGVSMLEGLQGDVTFPRQTGAGTSYWVGQSVDLTPADQALGQISLTPKTVGATTRLTRKLLMQSSPSAEALVRDDLLKILALAIDLAGLNGSGNAAQPLGLLNTSGIGSVSGTSLALAGILEFESDVAAGNAGNADVPSMKFVTTPGVRAALKARFRQSNTDTPLWEKDNTINGYGAFASNQIPSATMIFGDWSQLLMAMWGVLELKVADQGSGYLAGDVDLIAFQDCDVAVKQTAAFSAATSIS